MNFDKLCCVFNDFIDVHGESLIDFHGLSWICMELGGFGEMWMGMEGCMDVWIYGYMGM